MGRDLKLACIGVLFAALLYYLHSKSTGVIVGTGPTGNYVSNPTTTYPLSWKLGIPQTYSTTEESYTGRNTILRFIGRGPGLRTIQ